MTARKRAPIEVPAGSGGSAALDTLTEDAGLSLVSVDPAELAVDANVRSDLALTPEFVASVARGIIQPIVAYRDTLGVLRVLTGHRRAVAAVEAGLARVAVVVHPAPGDETERIVDQLTENELRTDLSTRDRARTYQQLALMGASAGSIAKRVSVKPADVEQALRVAESPKVAAALEEKPDLPLDLAAGMAELAALAAGDEDADSEVAELARVVEESGVGEARVELEYRLGQARRVVREREVIERFAAAGVTAWFGWTNPEGAVGLSDLTARPGKGNTPGPTMSLREHADCPARGVRLMLDEKQEGGVREVAHYCLDWKTSGHYKRAAANTSGATSGPRSAEEKDRRRAGKERRDRIAAVTKVRHAFVKDLLQRKTLPADAVVLVARVNVYWGVAGSAPHLREWGVVPAGEMVHELTSRGVGTVKQATRLLLAAAIAAVEERTSEHWYDERGTAPPPFAVLLETLASWGYELSDLETGVVERHRAKLAAAAAVAGETGS